MASSSIVHVSPQGATGNPELDDSTATRTFPVQFVSLHVPLGSVDVQLAHYMDLGIVGLEVEDGVTFSCANSRRTAVGGGLLSRHAAVVEINFG